MASTDKNIVVVGSGMAAARLVEEIVKLDTTCAITIIGEESALPYNRIMLSLFLSGEAEFSDTLLKSEDWYQKYNIELISGIKVSKIDQNHKQVQLADGGLIDFDKAILCTGSKPFVLPLPGSDLEGVCSYRTNDDVNYFLDTAQTYKNAVVIGGGLLGLEAANGLNHRGMQVTLVHVEDYLMERQLDKPSAKLLQEELEKKGITVYTNAKTTIIHGKQRVESISLDDGTQLKADLVVMAIGIRPMVELASDAMLECDNGIMVNDFMQTSDEHVYAIGECVQHRDTLFGLVNPIYEQAAVCANNILSTDLITYEGTMMYTLLKVTGIDVFSAGDIHVENTTENKKEEITFMDVRRGIYKKFFIRNDILLGAICYGDIQDANWYVDLIKEKTDLRGFREFLAFGKNYVSEETLNDQDIELGKSQHNLTNHAAAA